MVLFAAACSAIAQANIGELRLSVANPNGLGVKATVTVSSAADQYSNTLTTSDEGAVDFKRLAYGVYLVRVEKQGFSPRERQPLRSVQTSPVARSIQLAIAPVNTSVKSAASRRSNRPL